MTIREVTPKPVPVAGDLKPGIVYRHVGTERGILWMVVDKRYIDKAIITSIGDISDVWAVSLTTGSLAGTSKNTRVEVVCGAFQEESI